MVKTRTILIGTSIVFIIALIFSFMFTSGFGLLSTFGECSGGQVLSLDSATIRTSSDLGGRKVIRAVFSTVESSECLDIKLSQSQLQDELEDAGIRNFEVTDRILGDIKLTKKVIEFPINTRSSSKFFKFGEFDVGRGLVCTNNECRDAMRDRDIPTSNLISSIGHGGFLGIGNICTCVFDKQEGISGSFSSGSKLVWEAEISIGGKSLTLDNARRSGRIGNIAFVKWAGGLSGDIGFSRPDRDIMQSTTNNKFSLIDDGTFSELNTIRNSLRRELIKFGEPGGADAKPTINDMRAYNSLFDDLTSNNLNQWIAEEREVADAKFIGKDLVIDLNSAITYPTFTLDIIAEEVGIFISEGEPKVSCPSNFEITSGDLERQSAIVKNVGKASASFSYFVECDKGSQTVSPSSPKSIESGRSLNVILEVGLISESGKTTSRCKFTAVETNTLEEDSCFFNYKAEARTGCVTGEKSCELGNSELWECEADGGFKKTDCPNGCEAFGSSSRCRLQPQELCSNGIDDNGDGLVDGDDPQCKGGIGGFFGKIGDFFSRIFGGLFDFFTILKFAIVVIFSGVSIFVSSDILKKIKSLEKMNTMRWVLSVVIGIAVGFLLFSFIFSLLFFIILALGIVFLLFGKPILDALGVATR